MKQSQTHMTQTHLTDEDKDRLEHRIPLRSTPKIETKEPAIQEFPYPKEQVLRRAFYHWFTQKEPFVLELVYYSDEEVPIAKVSTGSESDRLTIKRYLDILSKNKTPLWSWDETLGLFCWDTKHARHFPDLKEIRLFWTHHKLLSVRGK